jgi:hypothetical protein
VGTCSYRYLRGAPVTDTPTPPPPPQRNLFVWIAVVAVLVLLALWLWRLFQNVETWRPASPTVWRQLWKHLPASGPGTRARLRAGRPRNRRSRRGLSRYAPARLGRCFRSSIASRRFFPPKRKGHRRSQPRQAGRRSIWRPESYNPRAGRAWVGRQPCRQTFPPLVLCSSVSDPVICPVLSLMCDHP